MLNGDNPVKVEIVYERDRCIHEKSVMAECKLCSESCPNRAINTSKESESPHFDSSKCFHCGTCLASCPHMAFVATNFSDRKIVARVAAQKSLLLRCFVPYGEIENLTSEADSYKIGTCLAALTPGVLLEIALDKQCALATDHCAACSLFGTAGASLARNIKAAKGLLGDWCRADNLTESTPLFLADPAQGSGARARVAGSPTDCCSRESTALRPTGPPETDVQKAMSLNMKARVHRLFDKKTRQKRLMPPPQGSFYAKSTIQHDVAWRHALQKLWKTASSEQTSGACYKWPVHSVDSHACLLCGTCIRMCPTGALRHSFHNNTYTQFFTPGLCVDCRLCVVSCLHHAIARSHRTSSRPFDEVICCTENAAVCIRCGNPIPEDCRMEGYCRHCAIELRIGTGVLQQGGFE